MLTRTLRTLRDSPTYLRDKAGLFNGASVGFTALLLNAIVLFLLLPIMLDGGSSFPEMMQQLGFGQLMGLALLGGSTIATSILVPLRLTGVFWGPRIGRYFDQIVLSGISPLRFVIGKVLAQNPILVLNLILMIPYIALSIALGGIPFFKFVACLFLVWLYSIMLSLICLWMSLYFNEAITAFSLMPVIAFLLMMGCLPGKFNPFVMTPAPALIHPLFEVLFQSTPAAMIGGPFGGPPLADFWVTFWACFACMGAIVAIAVVALSLGPLYGIVADNSTFGEVVFAGDAKRKSKFKMRFHIQRASELAFLYENRGEFLRRNDGVVRWSSLFATSMIIPIIGWGACWLLLTQFVAPFATNRPDSVELFYFVHLTNASVFGGGLLIAAFLFSHPKNTIFQQVPFFKGKQVTVERANNVAFFLFLILTALLTYAVPFLVDRYSGLPPSFAVLPATTTANPGFDVGRFAWASPIVISTMAVTIFLFLKLLCLQTWTKPVAIGLACTGYLMLICLAPMIPTILMDAFREARDIVWLRDNADLISMASPFVVFDQLTGSNEFRLKQVFDFRPFVGLHCFAIALTLVLIVVTQKRVKQIYLTNDATDALGQADTAVKEVAVKEVAANQVPQTEVVE